MSRELFGGISQLQWQQHHSFPNPFSVRLQQNPGEYLWFLSIFNPSFPAHLYLALPFLFLVSLFSLGDSLPVD